MQEVNTIRAVVLGASGVGKTSLCQRLMDQEFSESYVETRGGYLFTKQVKESQAGELTLELRDFSGNKVFDFLVKSHIIPENVFFLVWDASLPKTFDELIRYVDMIKAVSPRIIFVRNKTDLAAPMTEQENSKIKELMEDKEIKYAVVEISAKTSKNMLETFLDKIGQFLGKDLRLKPKEIKDSRLTKVLTRISPPKNSHQSEYKPHVFWHSRQVRRDNLKSDDDHNWLWLNLASIKHKKSSTAKWLQEQTKNDAKHIGTDDLPRFKTAFELLKYLDVEERNFAAKMVGAVYSISHSERSRKYLEDRKTVRELVYKMAKDIYDSGRQPSEEEFKKFPKRFEGIKTDVETIVKKHLSGDNPRNDMEVVTL